MHYVVDGSIDITAICTAAKWRGCACLVALEAAGLSPADADVYMRWAFATDAQYQRSVSQESLTPEQYARISIIASPDGLQPAPPAL